MITFPKHREIYDKAVVFQRWASLSRAYFRPSAVSRSDRDHRPIHLSARPRELRPRIEQIRIGADATSHTLPHDISLKAFYLIVVCAHDL